MNVTEQPMKRRLHPRTQIRLLAWVVCMLPVTPISVLLDLHLPWSCVVGAIGGLAGVILGNWLVRKAER